MNYQEAKELVTAFEQGTYPAAQWTHRAHVIMALWYTWHYPLPEARKRIKEGIRQYNLSVGGKNTDDSGYHETITELYIQVIVQYQLFFVHEDFETLLNRLDQQPFLDKGFPFRYYRKGDLMSKQARKTWVSPDLKLLLADEFKAADRLPQEAIRTAVEGMV